MDKVSKTLKNNYILLFIWELISTVVTLIKWSWDFSLFWLIVHIAIFALGYLFVANKNIIGGYIGIIVGIIMILSKNIVSALLGLILIIHSIKYLKVIKF